MRIPTGVPSCRSPCQLALLTLGLGFFAPGNIGAQVKCSLGRQPSVNYLGVCIGQKNVPVRVELEPGASSSGLWREGPPTPPAIRFSSRLTRRLTCTANSGAGFA